ncbi:autotransporter assembly complex protein TamB [Shewanella spartinae]|uniref:autotransporter assembly complex protein TamB n=1 Tax=Shewanella spartinae TaxID=2864205 RepID=UPI001C65A11B|nr:translocation/assembly module TamB domain-containing protein [Shewanella spartinae]QYJ92248.1 translocation/assembly module TamB domain-containing protein [Shewanella spartinae]
MIERPDGLDQGQMTQEQLLSAQGGEAAAQRSLLYRLLCWLRNLVRVLLYLPLALLILLAILIGTPFGSRIAVNLADLLVPDLSLSYGGGTLNGQLQLEHAKWQMTGIEVETEGLSLNWRPLCLLQRQVCVDELDADAVRVDIDTDLLTASSPDAPLEETTPTDETSEHGPLTLPIGIILNQSDLNQIRVRVNEMQFNAEQLAAKASWLETGLRVNRLDSAGLLVSIPLGQSEDDTQQNQTNSQIQAQKQVKGEPQDAKASWPLSQLPEVEIPMPIFVDGAHLVNSELRLGGRIDKFAAIDLAGSYLGYKITVDSLAFSHDYGKARLDGEMSLTQDYPMALHLEAELNANKISELPELKRQRLNAEINGGFSALAVKLKGEGHLALDLDAKGNLSTPAMPYEMTLSSPHLMWPLTQAQYEAKALNLTSSGSLAAQSLSLSGELKTPYHPWLSLNTQLTHQDQNVEVAALSVDSEMGKLDLKGKLGYGEAISWQLEADTQDLDLAQLDVMPDKPLPETQISGKLHSQGRFSDKQWSVGISQVDLEGQVDQYPLRLQGDISLNDKFQLNAEHLQLDALESQLTLSGRVDDAWALDGQLSVPALSLWDPSASGAIKAVINVSGDDEHPEVAINADTIEFKYADITVDKAKLIAFYRPQDAHQFALSLKSSGIKGQGMALSDLTLGFKGDIAKQKLGLQTYGDLQLNTSIASTFDEKTQRFDAKIKRISLNSRLGAMALDEPFDLYWDNKHAKGEISPFCWRHDAASLCLTDTAELGDKGDTRLQFAGDLGALLAPVLPENLKWRGPTQLDGELQWAKGTKPTGELTLAMAPGQFDLTTTKRHIEAQYHYLNLKARLDELQLAIDTQLESERFAKIDSQLTISTDPEHRLSGKIDLKDIDLHALADFTPQLEVLDGKVSSAIILGGTLNEPDLSGTVDLIDGQLAAAANPTLLDNIKLKLTLLGQTGQVKGQWTMGDGKAGLDGEIGWQEGLKGDLNFSGDKLAIIQPPLAILDVSPDLDISFSDKHLDISGKLDVPSGHIKIVQLPEGGVAESSDVVFNDSLASQAQVKDPIAVTSQIAVKVGDKLTIDGMGLRGMLVGTLELRQAAFKPPLLYGDIKVVNGNYKFMGQTLSIKAGEVQFIGPMAVPNLNIEAIREIKDEDVVAGVRITGTPLKPVVTLFSNPAKEQAEILSYIIKGTGLNNSSSDQNNALMMGAALTLGNQLGDNAFSNLGSSASGIIEKFGISNVQFDANDEGKVAISGFIGEDLMVKYGVGVFNPGYEMTVRYYLMSQLYLESVSGTISKTLDIYYNFDID